MNCYVCALSDLGRTAVGLCHNCSAALCIEHLVERRRELTFVAPLGREVALPLKERELLCHICKQALEQPHRLT
jgi:hypothetical protein